MTRSRTMLIVGVAMLLMDAGLARALVTPAQQCQAYVVLASSKYAQCRLKAESKFATTGDAGKRTSAFEKCTDKLESSFSKALQRFGAACPMTQAVGAFESVMNQCSDDVADAAAGGTAPVCGDGVIDVAGEQCDGADLGGESCTSLGFIGGALGCDGSCKLVTTACATPAFPASGQTTCWNVAGAVVACAGAGQDGTAQAGATLAYVDNGDGTITDTNTGLTWEKLSRDGSVHDRDTTYTWTDAVAVKIAALNAGLGFAGHKDWRVPNKKELESLLNLETFAPAIAAPFNTGCVAACTVTTCSCTSASDHWTSTTYANFPTAAWVVSFDTGLSFPDLKPTPYYVRAVRGGV